MGLAWRALIPVAAVGAAVAALLWLRSAPDLPPPPVLEGEPPAHVESATPPPVAVPPEEPAAAAAPEPAAGDEAIPLSRLLTWSDPDEPGPQRLRLEPGESASQQAGTDPKRRWYLEQRRDEHGPTNRERTRRETEAGVVVPLDESVAVRGGVRVDARDDPEAGTREKETAPTVGVEVRF